MLLSGCIVVAFALCLVAFAVLAVVNSVTAERFLNLFASSARAHYTEQLARLAIGTAIVIFSSSMRYSEVFELLGWLIVVTALGLLLIPWQWHHKFGKWAIPLAIRHLRLYAVGVFALGGFILYSVFS